VLMPARKRFLRYQSGYMGPDFFRAFTLAALETSPVRVPTARKQNREKVNWRFIHLPLWAIDPMVIKKVNNMLKELKALTPKP
jgi:hypothetical protein